MPSQKRCKERISIRDQVRVAMPFYVCEPSWGKAKHSLQFPQRPATLRGGRTSTARTPWSILGAWAAKVYREKQG